MSRDTVRRALETLRAEGLVQSEGSGHRATVVDPDGADLEVVKIQRGSRWRVRFATAAERRQWGAVPGRPLPMMEVRYGGRVSAYPCDRYEFTVS